KTLGLDGRPQSLPNFQEFGVDPRLAPSAARHLAHVPGGAMDPLQQRLQADAEDIVIVRAAEPSLGAELHVLYTTGRAGQSSQFVGERSDVLADERLQDGGQIQFLLLDDLLLLRALLAQVHLPLLALDDVREMDRRGIGTEMALHPDISGEEPLRSRR